LITLLTQTAVGCTLTLDTLFNNAVPLCPSGSVDYCMLACPKDWYVALPPLQLLQSVCQHLGYRWCWLLPSCSSWMRPRQHIHSNATTPFRRCFAHEPKTRGGVPLQCNIQTVRQQPLLSTGQQVKCIQLLLCWHADCSSGRRGSAADSNYILKLCNIRVFWAHQHAVIDTT
jgi:hypothetical protein